MTAHATHLRRRRSALQRLRERVWRWLRYIGDADYARRHDAGKKAGVTRRARKNTPKHHPECKWSFSVTTLDGDFEKATWMCVTECPAIGTPPNTPEPPARRWRTTAPEDARSQATTDPFGTRNRTS